MSAEDPPKTIAFVLPSLGAGGAERVAVRLMRSFLEQGYRVQFVLMRKEGELLEEVPPEVEIIDLRAPRMRYALRPLIRYFRDRPADAVQVRMWPLTVVAIIARLLARSSARLVVSDHAAYSKEFADRPRVRAALRWTIRLFYPLADVRLQVAEAAADDLARLSGLPRGSFTVIYNPVDKPSEGGRTNQAVEALWGDAKCRILSVGSLKPQKNQRLLIESFALLRKKRSARLMILGSGGLEQELRNFAASLGVGEDVIFTGHVLDPWPYYQAADLFVLSSNFEGYPNVLVEAMRCGLPVVSTDCESGPREILDGGRIGRLVAVGDAQGLARAMGDTLRSPPPAQVMRDRAEALSGAPIAKRYLQILIGLKLV